MRGSAGPGCTGRISRRRNAILLSVALSIAVLAVVTVILISDSDRDDVQAATIERSGTCGANPNWTLDSDGVLTISGKGDMYDYGDFDSKSPWREYEDSLKELVIEPGVTAIGDYAFFECDGFTGTLTIPEGVKTIGNGAFCDCDGFTGTLTIPEGVTAIGDSAFDHCCGFTGTLTIPEGVTVIDSDAFHGCDGFTGTLTIPEGVTTIGNYAFYECSGLTGPLIIPDSVTAIWGYAFAHCTSILQISFGNGLKGSTFDYRSFNSHTFYDTDGVTKLDVTADNMRGYTFIGQSAGKMIRQAHVHHVIYDADGGLASAPIQDDVAEGSSFTVASYSGTKDGFDFGGWSYGGSTYQPGSSIIMGTSDITLTAIWEKVRHHVTYDVNGGSASAPTQDDVAEGSTFIVASYPGTKDGSVFGGWSWNDRTYDPGDPVTMGTSDITLKAVWTPVPSGNDDGNMMIIIVIVIIVIAAVGAGVFFSIKKR